MKTVLALVLLLALGGCAVRGIDHFGNPGSNGNASEWSKLSSAIGK